MSTFKNLVGLKFNRLTVLRQADPVFSAAGNKRSRWHCLCDCGNETIVDTPKLNNGHTKSCGCYFKETRSTSALTHGMRNTRVYRIYAGMKTRCNNKKSDNYSIYGGRGIKLCPEWESDFLNFYRDMGDPPAGKSIDRINNDLGYCKENCRWATSSEQSNNQSTTLHFTYLNHTATLSEWAEILNVTRDVIKLRLRRNPFEYNIPKIVGKYGMTEKFKELFI